MPTKTVHIYKEQPSYSYFVIAASQLPSQAAQHVVVFSHREVELVTSTALAWLIKSVCGALGFRLSQLFGSGVKMMPEVRTVEVMVAGRAHFRIQQGAGSHKEASKPIVNCVGLTVLY